MGLGADKEKIVESIRNMNTNNRIIINRVGVCLRASFVRPGKLGSRLSGIQISGVRLLACYENRPPRVSCGMSDLMRDRDRVFNRSLRSVKNDDVSGNVRGIQIDV